MNTEDFSTTIVVDESAEAAFDAINNPRGWWSEEIEGNTSNVNDVFNYHYEDVHRCKIKITEAIPGSKVVWQVLENYFKFTEDSAEWTGTTIIFDITKQDNKTQVRMTHQGLVPSFECFNICQDSWTNYMHNSLRSLISTGTGKPNSKGKPQTENEKRLSAGED